MNQVPTPRRPKRAFTGALCLASATIALSGCLESPSSTSAPSTTAPFSPPTRDAPRTGNGPGGEGQTGPLRVIRVVDGDTIVVALDGRATKVRYIGVDTPESVKPNTPVECFAKKASALNRSLVEGRSVTLSFDRERTDRYGRLLAYVRNDRGVDVNSALIAAGAARTMSIRPNTSRASTFSTLQAKARKEQRGLWRECARSQGAVGTLVLSTG